MDAIQILTVQLQKHPKVCVIYCISKKKTRVSVLKTQSDCPSVALEKSYRFSECFLCLCSAPGSSPGQPCLCWVTAITTSRTSVRLQNATSSSRSCIQRWRTTRCITPSPSTKLVLTLRPPGLPLLWTTPAVTPRFRYTCSLVAHSTGRLDFLQKPVFLSPSL